MPSLNTLQRAERETDRAVSAKFADQPDESDARTEDTSSEIFYSFENNNLAAGYLGLIDRYTPRKFTNPVVDTHKGLHVWCVYGGLVVR